MFVSSASHSRPHEVIVLTISVRRLPRPRLHAHEVRVQRLRNGCRPALHRPLVPVQDRVGDLVRLPRRQHLLQRPRIILAHLCLRVQHVAVDLVDGF